MSSDNCSITIDEHTTSQGEIVFSGTCKRCGVPVWAASREDAQTRFVEHRDIPAPPADILAQPVTVDLVDDYPEWFITGRGYPVAAAVKCEHGEPLVGFCSQCG